MDAMIRFRWQQVGRVAWSVCVRTGLMLGSLLVSCGPSVYGACKSTSDCPIGTQCLSAPFCAGAAWKLCTVPCSSVAQCPAAPFSCPDGPQCVPPDGGTDDGGVCYYPACAL